MSRMARALESDLKQASAIFDLLGVYYSLPGGIAWNAQIKRVVFDNQESAVKFKQAAPSWEVLYTTQVKEHTCQDTH